MSFIVRLVFVVDGGEGWELQILRFKIPLCLLVHGRKSSRVSVG